MRAGPQTQNASRQRQLVIDYWPWAIPPAVLAVLLGPLFLTSSTFGQDWPNHLWLVWQQSRNVTALGHPSYFLQSHMGAFYPFYAFYGGTLYAVVGTASAVIGGHPLVAYIGSFVLAFTAAYAGCTWLSRQMGLHGWRAQIAGVLYVGSAYYLTSAYGRGDWPELIAISALPLVVAGALHLLRAPSMRALPTFVYVGAVVTLTGSHVITLVWGSTFLVAVAAVLFVAYRRELALGRGRVLAVLALTAAAAAVNLWWLLPAFAYRHHTLIAQHSSSVRFLGGGAQNRASEVFDPVRSNELGPPPLFAISPTNAKAPVVALGWALIALAVAWRTLSAPRRRIALGLIAIGVVLLALVMFHQPWLIVPSLWRNVQFVIRLQTYVTLAVTGLVLVGALAIGSIPSVRVRRALTLGLAAVGVLTAYQAYKQAWTMPSVLPSRHAVFANAHNAPPTSWYAEEDYADLAPPLKESTLGVVPGLTESNGQLSLPIETPRGRYVFHYTSAKAGTIWTNILGGPQFVNVTGGRAVGRTVASWMVVSLPPPDGKPRELAFSEAHPWPVKLGIAATLIAALGLLGVLAWLSVRGRAVLSERASAGGGQRLRDLRRDRPQEH
jgi:hypothetical protein